MEVCATLQRYTSPDHHYAKLHNVDHSVSELSHLPNELSVNVLPCAKRTGVLVSDSLVRNMHTSGLLEVILEGSGSASNVPPCKQEQTQHTSLRPQEAVKERTIVYSHH